MKSVRIRSYSGSYFAAFGLNTDQKKVRIQTLAGPRLFRQPNLRFLNLKILILKSFGISEGIRK